MADNPHFSKDQFTFAEVIRNLKHWILFFLAQWKVLFVAGLIGMAGGALISILKKPVFHAETSFVLEDGNGASLGQMSGLASLVGVNLGSLGGVSGLFQCDNIM